jgi:hypothetical protein
MADVEIGAWNLDLEDQTLDLERNRNLKIPARGQDEQWIFKNQGRALAQPSERSCERSMPDEAGFDFGGIRATPLPWLTPRRRTASPWHVGLQTASAPASASTSSHLTTAPSLVWLFNQKLQRQLPQQR